MAPFCAQLMECWIRDDHVPFAVVLTLVVCYMLHDLHIGRLCADVLHWKSETVRVERQLAMAEETNRAVVSRRRDWVEELQHQARVADERWRSHCEELHERARVAEEQLRRRDELEEAARATADRPIERAVFSVVESA